VVSRSDNGKNIQSTELWMEKKQMSFVVTNRNVCPGEEASGFAMD